MKIMRFWIYSLSLFQLNQIFINKYLKNNLKYFILLFILIAEGILPQSNELPTYHSNRKLVRNWDWLINKNSSRWTILLHSLFKSKECCTVLDCLLQGHHGQSWLDISLLCFPNTTDQKVWCIYVTFILKR